MSIKRLYETPIRIVEMGINTCWDKHHTCVQGEPSTEKMFRVIRKFRHSSTAENGRAIFEFTLNKPTGDDELSDGVLYNEMVNNKYFNISSIGMGKYLVSTNLRAIIEIDIPVEVKKQMVSDEYHFLLENKGV